MSAKQLGSLWDVEFAYKHPGKTTKHWRTVLTLLEGTEREATREAEQFYARPEETAVDFMVLPAEES